MDRTSLDTLNRAAIRKHWRDLGDRGGDPPAGLLDDLAASADAYALDYARECALVAISNDGTEATPPSAAKPAAAARRRAPARGQRASGAGKAGT